MHDVHHAIVEVNVVIGVLVRHCELLVVRVVPVVVCDDAVVRHTLVLKAFTVAFVFIVAIFHAILLYWRFCVHNFSTVLYLLPVFSPIVLFFLHAINFFHDVVDKFPVLFN